MMEERQAIFFPLVRTRIFEEVGAVYPGRVEEVRMRSGLTGVIVVREDDPKSAHIVLFGPGEDVPAIGDRVRLVVAHSGRGRHWRLERIESGDAEVPSS